MRLALLAAAALALAGCAPTSLELARELGRGIGETMAPLDAAALGRAIVETAAEKLRQQGAPEPAPRAEAAPGGLPRLPAPPPSAYVPPDPAFDGGKP